MKKVIIAIVAALVLTGVGVILFFVLRGGDEEKHTDRGDRADIADISDITGIADISDNSTAIINDGTQDNAKEESQTDVIVTVNGGTELNLTGDVGEVIRKVNDDNGLVYDHSRMFSLAYDIKTNNIYIPYGANAKKELIDNTKDYSVGIAPNKNSGLLVDIPSCSGEMRFLFRKNTEDDDRLDIDRLSLLEGWKGDVSKINEYLNEKYSIIYPDVMNDPRVVLFRDGKLVPIDEITDEYGKEAERIILDYDWSIERYYQDKKNIDQIKAYEYMCGTVGYFVCYQKSSALKTLLNKTTTTISDSPYYPALYKEICMQLAMNDWAAEDDGSIQNYGCINWKLNEREELLVSVPCTHEDFLRVYQPYVERTEGELTPYKLQ